MGAVAYQYEYEYVIDARTRDCWLPGDGNVIWNNDKSSSSLSVMLEPDHAERRTQTHSQNQPPAPQTAGDAFVAVAVPKDSCADECVDKFALAELDE